MTQHVESQHVANWGVIDIIYANKNHHQPCKSTTMKGMERMHPKQ